MGLEASNYMNLEYFPYLLFDFDQMRNVREMIKKGVI